MTIGLTFLRVSNSITSKRSCIVSMIIRIVHSIGNIAHCHGLLLSLVLLWSARINKATITFFSIDLESTHCLLSTLHLIQGRRVHLDYSFVHIILTNDRLIEFFPALSPLWIHSQPLLLGCTEHLLSLVRESQNIVRLRSVAEAAFKTQSLVSGNVTTAIKQQLCIIYPWLGIHLYLLLLSSLRLSL